MINQIYAGEMKELLEGIPQPDWTTIDQKVKPFGAPGEENLLRAKTVHFFNAQDWEKYAPVTKEYLEKYKTNLRRMKRKCLGRRWRNDLFVLVARQVGQTLSRLFP